MSKTELPYRESLESRVARKLEAMLYGSQRQEFGTLDYAEVAIAEVRAFDREHAEQSYREPTEAEVNAALEAFVPYTDDDTEIGAELAMHEALAAAYRIRDLGHSASRAEQALRPIQVTDEMVERANIAYLGENWERDYHPPGQEANRTDMRVALEAALNGATEQAEGDT